MSIARSMIRNVVSFLLVCFAVSPVISQTVTYYQTGEEFVGPFPSWKNVKTDYGAIGNGTSDDAAALNAALVACKSTATNTWNVLYFPAGTYKINSTLYNSGRSAGGDDYSGMAIIGEDPATTVISWGGADSAIMFKLDGWYMRVSRLSFAGNSKGCIGISRDGGFGTGCEFSDLEFRDLNYGIDFSAPISGQGQAENTIIRCKFINNNCGMMCCNWNSLDEWVWYCLFQDCNYGIQSCIGYFQVYGNVFLRSKTIDINTAPYSQTIAENISIGSKCFFNGDGYLRGNKIYNTTDTLSLRLEGNSNTLVMVDNIVRSVTNASPVVSVGGNHLFIGNTFTAGPWPMQPNHASGDWTSIGGAQNGFVPLTRIADNNTTTAFKGTLWDTPCGIRWNCPLGTTGTVVKYTITAASGSDYPTKFLVRASSNWGTSWDTLDSRSGQTFTNGQKKEFTIQNPGSYAMYELIVWEGTGTNKAPTGGFVTIGSEVELLDAQSVDIMDDANGLLSGLKQHSGWGKFYIVDQKMVSPSTIAVPTTVSLPGTPQNHNRTILEVTKGTGDDAAEIQKKILSACSTSVYGARAVVHIPKGSFDIKRMMYVLPKKDIQIIGDGAGSGQITKLTWSGTGAGPLLRCLGPSKVTIKDMSIGVPFDNGPEVVSVEKADQVGGRIYGCQFEATGRDAGSQAGIGMFVDGVENSDVTLICGGAGGCWTAGILAKGGPVLNTGGTTNGMISLLSGAQSNCQNLLDVSRGGRVVSEGTWYEGELNSNPQRTSGLINLTNSRGSVSIACMSWHLAACPIPMLNINNLNGTFTCVANGFDDRDKNAGLAIAGSGTNCNVLAACNGWSNTPSTTDSLWQDLTSPAAHAALLNNGSYENVFNKVHNAVPDTAFVLASMAQLRAVRATPPMDNSDTSITDVKFFRVKISGAKNKTVFRISRDWTGLDSTSGVLAPMNNYNNAQFTRTQKMIMTGGVVRLPVFTKNVMVYNVQGQLVYQASIDNMLDIHTVEKTIARFGRHAVLIVRASK